MLYLVRQLGMVLAQIGEIVMFDSGGCTFCGATQVGQTQVRGESRVQHFACGTELYLATHRGIYLPVVGWRKMIEARWVQTATCENAVLARVV